MKEGAGAWQHEMDGDVTAGTTAVDMQDDLDVGGDTDNLFYVAVEHGVPILPNLMVQHVSVSTNGTNA